MLQPPRPNQLHLTNRIHIFTSQAVLFDLNSRHTMFGDHSSNANGIKLADLLIDLPIIRDPNTLSTYLSHLGLSTKDHILVTDACS